MTAFRIEPDQARQGRRLCIMYGKRVIARTPRATNEDHVNARQIVHALNNHAALVKALEELLEYARCNEDRQSDHKNILDNAQGVYLKAFGAFGAEVGS